MDDPPPSSYSPIPEWEQNQVTVEDWHQRQRDIARWEKMLEHIKQLYAARTGRSEDDPAIASPS